ncbi:MAG: GNAT family N-acetyltransferase [Desulfoprunum sp.]|nr:GNAT family N-acetyltransferase [Desulfoprunum sp.]
MITICRAELKDAEDILALQKLAYQSEARLYNDWSLPPLRQSLESLLEEFGESVVLKAVSNGRIVGSVRAKATLEVCAIGRLVVHPDFQGQGIGSQLLKSIEVEFPEVSRYELFTGSKSEANIRLYQRHGYEISRTQRLSPAVLLVFLRKPLDFGGSCTYDFTYEKEV